MKKFKEFLLTNERYKDISNHNHRALDITDDGNGGSKDDILLYNLRLLDKGKIELTHNDKLYEISLSKDWIKEIEKIIGRELDLKDPDFRRFLKSLPCLKG
jgi:hypothetical protein